MVNQGVANQLAIANHYLPKVIRNTRLDGQVAGKQHGECSLIVGLLNHGVASNQCRNHVEHGQGQWVVPRSNHANDTHRHVVYESFGKHRNTRLGAAASKSFASDFGKVARSRDCARALFEGMGPGLAGFELQKIEQLGLVFEHQVG